MNTNSNQPIPKKKKASFFTKTLIQSYSRSLLLLVTILMTMFNLNSCKKDDTNVDDTLRIRKNAKDLTSSEKADYVNAILKLKETPSPYNDTLNYYDQFVRFHQMAVEKKLCDTINHYGVAHTNPAFPPWHRKLLLLYEDALREVSGKNITLPYWDWTDPESTNATFASDLMGGNGDPNDEYALNDGPFRKSQFKINLFTIRADYALLNPHPWIVRNFAATISEAVYPGYPGYPVSLPTDMDVNRCLDIPIYDMEPWDCNHPEIPNTSFRFCLEGFTQDSCAGPQAVHNIGHDWIAGFFTIPVDTIKVVEVTTINPECSMEIKAMVPNNVRIGSMEPLDVSPNDPAFFMHHCNVDRVWELWQQKYGVEDQYKPVSGAPNGYNLNDDMYPYLLFLGEGKMDDHGITPNCMLSIRDLGYSYE